MTREELEQKARENFLNKPLGYENKYELDIYTDGYVEGAEQETALLSKHILEFQAYKGKLIDENRKAREIIKMLIRTVRELNNPNVQLTDVNGYLAEAEQFLNKGDEKD